MKVNSTKRDGLKSADVTLSLRELVAILHAIGKTTNADLMNKYPGLYTAGEGVAYGVFTQIKELIGEETLAELERKTA